MESSFRNIYIVDDNHHSIYITKYFLKSIYTEPVLFDFLQPEKGLEFILLNQSNETDLLFLDINMPTITGWQFLEELGDKWSDVQLKNLKVCILTSSTREEDSKKAALHPLVTHYAEKPANQEEMNLIINALEEAS